MARPSSSQLTRERMIFAAETLVATRGLGGASAREIAKAANLRNNCSVQYHFGSMEGLFQEIVRYRMSQLDEIRADMMEERLARGGALDRTDLIELICLPHLRLQSGDGLLSYAAFLCQYLPIYHPAGFKWVMRASDSGMPAIGRILEALRVEVPQLPPDIFDRRITSATLLFLNTVQGLSRQDAIDVEPRDAEALIGDAIRQSVAVLSAPFRKQ